MRALAIVLLIASVSCRREEKVAARADPEAKKGAVPAAILIHKKTPRVGLRVREEKKLDLNFEFVIGTTKQSTTKRESSTRLEEVLASDGLRATKLRVTYEAHDQVENLMGSAPALRPSPVVGKTYVVDTADAGVTVTDLAGKRPPPDELAIVESDYRSFADDDVVVRGIPDTPLRVGDPVPSLANALKSRVLGKSATDVESDVVVTVDSFANMGSEVVFKVKATFTMGGAKMTVPMTGKVHVRTEDGLIAAFVMDGEMKLGGDAGKNPDEGVTAPEDLMKEHGVLNRCLLLYEEAQRRLERKEEIPPEAFHHTADLIRLFVEEYHERNEETYIFPEFRRAGKLRDLVETLQRQHRAGRRLTSEILRLSRPDPYRSPENRRRISR